MIEMFQIYDKLHTNGIINALICINNHVNSCIKCMLSGRQLIFSLDRSSDHRRSP